jgi:hypothetical protein
VRDRVAIRIGRANTVAGYLHAFSRCMGSDCIVEYPW